MVRPPRARWAAPATAAVVLGVAVAWSGIAPGARTWAVVGCVVVSVVLMHLGVGLLDLRRISFPAFWYIMYVAAVFVPGLLLAAERIGPVRDRYLFAITSGLITVPLGILLVNVLGGDGRVLVRRFFDTPCETGRAGVHATALFWAVVAAAGGLTVLYVLEVDTIPLFYLVRNPGATAEVVLLREDAFKLLDSPFLYWYDVLRRVGFPLLTALALGRWLSTRERRWLRAALVAGGLGVFFAALSLAKAPVALLILVACFTWYLHRQGRLRVSQLVAGASAVLAFPIVVLLGLAQRSDVTVWILLQAIFRRLFSLPAEILYAYFEMFPDHLGFLHGRTIGRVAWITGQPAFDIANYAFNYLYPGGVESGSAPASFLGYFYADFGMAGVLVGGLLTGVIMQGVHLYLLRRPKTVLTIAAYAFMYWAFWQVNLAALPQTLLSGGVLFVLAGVVAFELGERVLRRIAGTPVTLQS